MILNQNKKGYEFPLQSFRAEYRKDHLEILKFHYVEGLIQPLYKEQVKLMGKIVCMAVTDEQIAVAGSLGNIMVFDRETLEQEMYGVGQKQGKITVLDIYENIMVVGFEDGTEAFIDIDH